MESQQEGGSDGVRTESEAVPAAIAEEPSHPRYVFSEVLGSGASARVLAARDRTFDREVAIKSLIADGGDSSARFLREARITAMIDHPNVVTVHDLEFTSTGGAYLVMRRIRGVSLGRLVRDFEDGRRDALIATTNTVVSLILRVCDALDRAHELGIIHRDVKPDNILIGSHGDVVLADWGEAVLQGADQGPKMIVGTPAYMSPEQARGDAADARSDIYALGATLFHVLAGRPPMEVSEVTVAVERRARGEWQEPTIAEMSRLPASILAIVRQAMDPDPRRRYQRIGDFRSDLVRFQEGLSVGAMHEPLPVRAMRWLWRRRRGAAVALVVFALTAALSLFVIWERERGIARWGEPIVEERFADDRWSERWREQGSGTWRRRDGRIVTTGPEGAFLVWPRRLMAPVAVEYDAEIVEGAAPSEMSCVWWEGGSLEPGRFGQDPARSYWVQLGAWGDSFSCITRRPGERRVAYSPRRLDPQRRYHMRIEFENDAIRAFVDGELWLEHLDLFPVRGGYVGLYGYFPGKAFSDIRIWSKGVPERLPVLALGDSQFVHGRYGEAIEEWSHVVESHPGGSLAADALLRMGLARQEGGDHEAANRMWSRLTGEHADQARVLRLRGVWAEGDDGQFAASFAEAWHDLPRQHTRLSTLWSDCAGEVKRLPQLSHERRLARLVDLRQGIMGNDPDTVVDAAELLIRLGRAPEVIDGMADSVRAWSDGMAAMGRNRELADATSQAVWYRAPALVAMGRIDEALAVPGCPADTRTLCLVKSGASAAARVAGDPAAYEVLAGDPEKALVGPMCRGEIANAACILLGDIRKAAVLGENDGSGRGSSRHAQMLLRCEALPEDQLFLRREELWQASWMRCMEEGLRPTGAVLAGASADPSDQRRLATWFVPWFAVPFCQGSLSGPTGRKLMAIRSQTSIDMLAQRPYFLARLLAGGIDRDSFMRQPFRAEAPAWWFVGSGMRAELDGDRSAALNAYRNFRALPAQQRLLDRYFPDPMVERFVSWRLAVLSGGDR